MSNQLQATQADRAPQQVPDGQGREQPFVVPPVDVFEADAGIPLLADMPGVSRDRLGVRVDGDSLLLEATAATAEPKDMQLVYGEAGVASYPRQFTPPPVLD